MKKQKVVDLVLYRQGDATLQKGTPMSEDLKIAIQNLIHRLRELGPLPY